MKIERVNENQIRCTLNKDDLASRQLKISELAYGSDKAKELFRDMMQQASYEVGFEAEDIPLMIEAIPISADCIVLIVTKVENPEELDTRFSKFSPSDDGEYDYDDEYSDMETIDDSSSYTDSSVPPTAGDELDIATKQTKSEGGVIGDDLMNLFSKVREYLNNTNKTPDNTSLPSKKIFGDLTNTVRLNYTGYIHEKHTLTAGIEVNTQKLQHYWFDNGSGKKFDAQTYVLYLQEDY